MKQINLDVTIDEANLILEALGHLPFVKVYTLIGKVQEQARRQLNGDAGELGEAVGAGEAEGLGDAAASPRIAE